MSAVDNIRRLANGRPVVTHGQVANALGIESFGLDVRMRNTPGLTPVEFWKAGGQRFLTTDAAVDWLAIHEPEFEAHLRKVGQAWRLEK